MKKYLFLFTILVLSLCFQGCQEKARNNQAEDVKKMSLKIPVDIDVAREWPIIRKLDVVGSFDYDVTVKLSPQIGGKVKNVFVKMGDKVKKGQVLVKLDDTDTLIQIKQDKADLDQVLAKLGLSSINEKLKSRDSVPYVIKAKAAMDNDYINWQRNIRMRKADLISDKDVDDSKTNYLKDKAEYESQLHLVDQDLATIQGKAAKLEMNKQKLKYALLVSPIDGAVQEQKVYTGDYMQTGDTALVLVSSHPLLLNVNIPEKYVRKVVLGHRLDVITDAMPGKVFRGKIIHINPVVNSDNRTISMQARIENPAYLLKPGMFGEITIIAGKENVVLVPEASLVDTMGVTKVYVIKKEGNVHKAVEHKVTRGERDGDWFEIKGDIKNGDMIAVTGLGALVNGVEVTIKKKNELKPPKGIPGI